MRLIDEGIQLEMNLKSMSREELERAYIVKRHIVGGGNSRLFSVHPPLLIVRYQC